MRQSEGWNNLNILYNLIFKHLLTDVVNEHQNRNIGGPEIVEN